MNRKVTIGPQRVVARVGTLAAYLEELQAHGVPDEAQIRSDTSPDGLLLVNIEYEDEVGPTDQAAPRPPQRENSGTEPVGLIR